MSDQPMRAIRVEKIVINVGVGEAGDRLLKAQKVLEMITGQKAVQTVSRSTIRDWGIRDRMPIGCKVTLRRTRALDFLRKALAVRNRRLPAYSFDPEGNFSFGIPDYTDFEGMKYDPEIGVYGMDVSVVLERPGFRVKRRRLLRGSIPADHRIRRQEGIDFAREQFQVEVVD